MSDHLERSISPSPQFNQHYPSLGHFLVDPETTPELEPSLSIATSSLITLQVGERRFITTADTLMQESSFFSSLLSGRWKDNTESDGSYFIDADGDVFKHILRYWRHGVFPLFYDKPRGYDRQLYQLLLEQARYFGIPSLVNWIKDQKYLQAVQITTSFHEVEGMAVSSETTGADLEVEYHPKWTVEKVYLCPRGIFVHKGNPSACGRVCKNVQGDGDNEYENKDVLKTLVITRKPIFNQQVCTGRE